MATEAAARITDRVVAELVECAPEISVEERAFRAGYAAYDDAGTYGSCDIAWQQYQEQKSTEVNG